MKTLKDKKSQQKDWKDQFRIIEGSKWTFPSEVCIEWSALKELVSTERQRAKKEIISLNKAELNQLIELVKYIVKEGSYYGNPEQYYRRNEHILEKLNKLGKEK